MKENSLFALDIITCDYFEDNVFYPKNKERVNSE